MYPIDPENSSNVKNMSGSMYFQMNDKERARVQKEMTENFHRVKQATNVMIPEDVR